MIAYCEDRLLVPLDTDQYVIPDHWFRMYGHVLLPAKWNASSWGRLSKKDKRFVYLNLSSYKVWFRNIFLPFESLRERGLSSTELDMIYPAKPVSPDIVDFDSLTGLPPFINNYCDTLEKHTPLGFIISENKPEHSNVWSVLWVLPTGCFKSTVTGKGFPLYRIGCDPTVSILIAVEAAGLGDRFINAIKSHIIQNERFRWLHGDLHADDSTGTWQAGCIVVDRPIDRDSSSVEIVGYRGSVQGERFDIVVADDVISAENSRTQESRLRMKNWLDGGEFQGRLNPERRMRLVVGTFQHYGDYYHTKKGEAEEKGVWAYHEEDMIQGGTWPPKRIDPDQPDHMDNIRIPEDLVTIWPQEWTAEKLVPDWLNNKTTFAQTRQNILIDPEEQWFPVQLLEAVKADGAGYLDSKKYKPLLSRWPISIGIPPEGSGLYNLYSEMGFNIDRFDRIITVDLASTESQWSDYTVFQLWALDRDSQIRIILNQLRRKTADPGKLGGLLRDWVSAYHPSKLIVEANAVEKLFARGLSKVIGFPVTIKPLDKRKTEMILNVRDLIQSNLLWVPWADDNYRTQYVFASFIDELNEYPFGVHDDTVAAAAHALDEMRIPSGVSRATIIKGKSPRELAGVDIEVGDNTGRRGVTVVSASASSSPPKEISGLDLENPAVLKQVKEIVNSGLLVENDEKSGKTGSGNGPKQGKGHPARKYAKKN